MSRTLRHQLPCAAFHITARTQGREPWFREHGLEQRICEIIDECITTSDAMLLARTVMPNHLHIVLRQGPRPLAYSLQPALRRIALLVQRVRQAGGHIFEREFRSCVCGDATYLRRTLTYTHLNPVRKGLCTDMCEYPWTSHERYLSVTAATPADDPSMYALGLFARTEADGPERMVQNYLEYIRWRLEKDRHDEAGMSFDLPEPWYPFGDGHFADRFCGLPMVSRKHRVDLRDRALQHLERIDTALTIDELRGSFLPRAKRAARKQLIAALLQDRYRGCSIADFLRISDTTVSAVASELRYAPVGA